MSMQVAAPSFARDQVFSGFDGHYRLLRRLRREGWSVRLKKRSKSVSAAPSADGLQDALRAALTAYRRASMVQGEGGLPCRAALEAYRALRPDDARSSERVICALAVAMKQRPDVFLTARAMGI